MTKTQLLTDFKAQDQTIQDWFQLWLEAAPLPTHLRGYIEGRSEVFSDAIDHRSPDFKMEITCILEDCLPVEWGTEAPLLRTTKPDSIDPSMSITTFEKPSGIPAIPPLEWREEHDYDDNSYWEADGPYCDEDGGVLFQWVIKQRLVKNAIEFYDATPDEFVADSQSRRVWKTLEEAQAQISRDHAEILADALREESPCPEE